MKKRQPRVDISVKSCLCRYVSLAHRRWRVLSVLPFTEQCPVGSLEQVAVDVHLGVSVHLSRLLSGDIYMLLGFAELLLNVFMHFC